MWAQNLYKIAKQLLAAKKWSGFVHSYVYQTILKQQDNLQDEFGQKIQLPNNLFTGQFAEDRKQANDKIFQFLQTLDEQLKTKIEERKNQIIQKFQNFIIDVANILSQCSINGKNKKIQPNKVFAQKIFDMSIKAGHNPLLQFDRNNVLNIFDDYRKYYQFIEKQDQNYQQFDSMVQLKKSVDKYVEADKKANAKFVDSDQIFTKGQYKIAKYTKVSPFQKLTKGSGWCVSSSVHMFEHYGEPYYVVYKSDKMHSLINFNSRQNKALNNQCIRDMDQQLANLQIQLMKKQIGKLVFGGDFRILYPYYGVQDLLNAVDNGVIQYSAIQPTIIKYFQNGDKETIDKIVSNKNFNASSLINSVCTQNQYKTIMLKVFPKTDQNTKDQQHLKDNVKLSKQQVIAIMFNAFKKGKAGLGLFGRMVKFAQNSQGSYSQYDKVNQQIAQSKDSTGNPLSSYVSKLNQIKILKTLGIQLTVADTQNILKNVSQQDSVNPQLMNYLKDNNLFQLNEQLLTTVVTTRKPGIVEYFLKNTDLDFNQQMTNRQLPILYTIQNNNQTIFKLFKQSDKIKIEQTGQNSVKLLYSVMKSHNIDIITYFLNDTKLDFNQVMYDNMTPLFYAIKQRMGNVLQLFLNSDKIDSSKSVNGRSLLYWAIQTNQEKLIQFAVQKASEEEVNSPYLSGKLKNETIITYAIKTDNKILFDYALKNPNINVNIQTPVNLCILTNKMNYLKAILQHKGGKFKFLDDYKDQNGDAPIVVAIKNANGNYEIFKQVAKHTAVNKASLSNTINGQVVTPLMVAIDYNMPIDLIQSVFGKKNVSFSNQNNLKTLTKLIDDKLAGKFKNDANMIAIKAWVVEQNKSKVKSKQQVLQKTLFDLAAYGKLQRFKQTLTEKIDQIDLQKKISPRGTLLQCLVTTDAYFDYVVYLITNYKDTQKLKSVLEQKKNGKNILELSRGKRIKAFLNKFYSDNGIKIASKQSRIFDFVAKYLR